MRQQRLVDHKRLVDAQALQCVLLRGIVRILFIVNVDLLGLRHRVAVGVHFRVAVLIYRLIGVSRLCVPLCSNSGKQFLRRKLLVGTGRAVVCIQNFGVRI